MLVGLQVMSSKEGGRREEEEGELFDKILLAWTKSLCRPWGQPGIALGATKGPSPEGPTSGGVDPGGAKLRGAKPRWTKLRCPS